MVVSPRFIPARAGNTLKCFSCSSHPAVHPRSRGEHAQDIHPDRALFGSSPLARGTPGPWDRGAHSSRFIPARAGNTSRSPTSRRDSTVHPRSRGEHTFRPCSTRLFGGSSPLARGTRSSLRAVPISHRFIPARAGNTVVCPSSSRASAVHPRSRGEHGHADEIQVASYGSSPLARGTRPTPSDRVTSVPVHPRSRGEHSRMRLPSTAPSGSSPLARGTLSSRRERDAGLRFIPARAGNTARTSCAARASAVHPRSRGEHVVVTAATHPDYGSSPLARGTPVRTI